MTNEDYIQWEPLVKKIAYKYMDNIYKIEFEDLTQIGAIGLFKGFESYDSSKGKTLTSWLYESVERSIFREFQNMDRIKRQANYKSISFDTPTNEDKDLYLGDIISDDNVNVEAAVVNKLMVEKYKEEINLVLSGREKEIVYRTLFEGAKFIDLAKEYDTSHTTIRDIQRRGFRNLKNKSKMIIDKWLKMREDELEANLLSQYNDPERVYFSIQTSGRLLKKYKKEIDILNFIQELFDSMSFDFKFKKYSSFILSLDIFNKRDIELFNKRKINKMTQDELLKQGYGYIEILDIEKSVKKAILRNKEEVYKTWIGFSSNNDIVV